MNAVERLGTLSDALTEQFADYKLIQHRQELTLVVPRDELLDVCHKLVQNNAFQFEQCIDVCGVDYLTYGEDEFSSTEASSTGFCRGVEWVVPQDTAMENRFAVVYHLLSIENNQRLRLRVYLDTAKPQVDSVTAIWTGANWFEREVFDLFGFLFKGHPDLRRILTDYGFVGHPFRKDFPLSGHVQMRYDEKEGRVIYEPIDIEPRVLVPRIIRKDSRYQKTEEES